MVWRARFDESNSDDACDMTSEGYIEGNSK